MTTNNDQDEQYFHFTLGPVQSFVGQARRTRDFWAGSFLLAWLSGVAMQSVIEQGGEILFPTADQNFLDAITGKNVSPPKQASLPNRFKASVTTNFDANKVVANVQKVWQQLAKNLYQQELTSIALEDTKSIWDRQVNHFWDMSWVIVNDIKDSSALDKRKNMRSHFIPDEAGIRCSLMGDWQELSGITGVRRQHRIDRESFWEKVAKKSTSDFTQKEVLCAISYIKRRFLSVFSGLKVELDGWTAHGWSLPKSVPSVAYIAAAPWYAQVLAQEEAQHENSSEFSLFFKDAQKLGGLPEYQTSINCVSEHSTKNTKKKHEALDGNMFHISALENSNKILDQEQAKSVIKHLKALIEKFGAISPFYDVLMMDGDSLGKQMSDVEKQSDITQGLDEFISKVPDIVQQNNGFLIYAGGDDVLALVTLEDALNCALAIRTHYMESFSGKPVNTTISAAIIYTHINTPLKNILHESHELLDDVAKEATGRDALAVRVYKGSGIALQWSKNWDDAIQDKTIVIDSLANYFSNQSSSDAASTMSSGFFYKIREGFSLFSTEDNSSISYEDMLNLMTIEYLQSSDNRKVTFEDAKTSISPLINQCRVTRKNLSGKKEELDQITIDAALLIRFLAQKGIEGGRA